MGSFETLESRCLMSFVPIGFVDPYAGLIAASLQPAGATHATASRAAVSAAIAAPSPVTTTQVGTTDLKLQWPRVAGVTSYKISFVPGAYIPGIDNTRKTFTVGSTATTANLYNLRPFTLYSIDVTAVSPTGSRTTHVNAWTAKPSATHRYLYSFELAKSRQGFQTQKPQIEVFDIDNGHQWVKNIPLPK